MKAHRDPAVNWVPFPMEDRQCTSIGAVHRWSWCNDCRGWKYTDRICKDIPNISTKLLQNSLAWLVN